MEALERWERALDAILAGRRRRLSGAEYVALVDEIDRADDARAVRMIALRLAEKLGRLDGATGQTHLTDPSVARAYLAGKRACANDAGNAPRAAECDAPRPQASSRDRIVRPRPMV